jgi:hypothetical protein
MARRPLKKIALSNPPHCWSISHTPFFDSENEHEDDDEYEKQSPIVSILWWAITTVRKRIYATLGKNIHD